MISTAVLAGALWIFHSCAPTAPSLVLAGIAMQESGFNADAIHDNTDRRSYYPSGPNASVDLAATLIARGHQIDVGLLGIDYTSWVRHDVPIVAAFDDCANARISSQILMGDYASALSSGFRGRAAWFAALSAYNSGLLRSQVGASYAASVFANMSALLPRLTVAEAGLVQMPTSALPASAVAPPAEAASARAYSEALRTARARQAEATRHYRAILRALQGKSNK